ncbi:tail fiber domain-containing protein [Stenotrophomonas sp. GD03657]|uniref:tail fiber domain-containing protein n=1 Tax=Stenotrophomonas sp. GD03657 TaxID=2975363 RepID=UPI00244A6A88|nr:tail fiber domain-containing protein [Stenotrophomonas sp. GD03657]MDH2154243.1 tail fiber domain-containing protein [Stenotrophomonas sp. GD03657]
MSSAVLPIKYPLDLSGVSPLNRVAGEPHVLGTSNRRSVIPSYGPFYTRGLVVRNKVTGQVLEKVTQYKAIQMMPKPTKASGQTVCAALVIEDLTVTEVEIDYQVVGGEYSTSIEAIENMIASLAVDNRPVKWGQIIGKPNAFVPTSHLHDVGDIYGFEYIVASLYSIRDAILVGDQASHQELIDMFTRMVGDVDAELDALRQLFNTHVADKENPHDVNATQVGLGNVQNFPIATQSEAEQGTLTNRYMTPQRVAQAIQALVGIKVDNHISNTNNPHNVTKTQVQLGNVQNFGLATDPEAQAGVVNNKYMTPYLVKLAIDALALPVINAHINRLDNPHQTNAAQVGLGLVQNYGVATTTEAQQGTVTNKYMTPALVRAAILATVGTDLTNHINDRNNPHGTTKGQVGLGNVLDYGMADQPTAEGGSSNTAYMSPLRVAQAITARAINPLQQQINQRVATGSDAAVNSLQISSQGYLYMDGDGSISLRVVGSRFFQFHSGGNFIAHSGRVVAAGGFQPSDRRLKKDISKLDARPLWRGFNFKQWEMIESGLKQRGAIAQDLQKVAPDLIYEYDHLSPRSKRSVKRLSVEVGNAAFEMSYAAGREVDALRAHVTNLETRLAALESKA